MNLQRAVVSVPALILLAGTAQCGAGSDAPPAQAVLWIDTDAPSSSLAVDDKNNPAVDVHFGDASIDTLRIDLLDQDNVTIGRREISAPDETNWPVSLGLQSFPNVPVARLRIRGFRAMRAELGTDEDTGAQVYEPIPAYTIDRVVEVPLPSEKGSYAFRVVLRSGCRGAYPSFTEGTSCVDAVHPRGDFRDGIDYVPRGTTPLREPIGWPGDDVRDCEKVICPEDAICIAGGFFMLGNTRVVGFGALGRHDPVPAHPVSMKALCIDRKEMTVGAWKQLAAQNPALVLKSRPAADSLCTWTSTVPWPIQPAISVDTPLNCVSWEEAEAACEAKGALAQRKGRLPTEAEWEYVATGRGRGFLFPWGDDPPQCVSSSLGRYNPFGAPSCAPDAGTQAVETSGSHKSDAAEHLADLDRGVIDLAGSLSEWMRDNFASYDADPKCWQRDGMLFDPVCVADMGEGHSVRGGSYATPREVSYAALRNAKDSGDRFGGLDDLGFRCVFPIGTDPVEEALAQAAQPEQDAGPVDIDAGISEPPSPSDDAAIPDAQKVGWP